MRVQVALIGSGVQGDAYRVPLPNYSMVTVDYVTRTAIVDIPDADAPQLLPVPGSPLFPVVKGEAILVGLTPQQQAAWQETMAARFGARAADIDVWGLK